MQMDTNVYNEATVIDLIAINLEKRVCLPKGRYKKKKKKKCVSQDKCLSAGDRVSRHVPVRAHAHWFLPETTT